MAIQGNNLRTSGFYSLFARFNKKRGQQDQKEEGLLESLGELTLDIDDETLNERLTAYDLVYAGSLTKARITEQGDICEKYWIGRQYPDTE